VHFFPVLAAYISRFGSPEGGGTLQEAKKLDDKFNRPDQANWVLPYVHAAFRAWWLAEYGGWFGEHYDGSLQNFNLEEG